MFDIKLNNPAREASLPAQSPSLWFQLSLLFLINASHEAKHLCFFCMVLFYVYTHSVNICNDNVIFCLNVPPVPCPPCHPFMRSEFRPPVKHLHIELTSTLRLSALALCATALLLLSIDLNYRSILLNTRTNILPSALKNSSLTYRNLIPLLMIISYLIIYDCYFIIFLPFEFFKVQLNIKARAKQSFKIVNILLQGSVTEYHVLFILI